MTAQLTENDSRQAAPAQTIARLAQLNRTRRGHDFFGPELLNAPDLYATEEIPSAEKTVHAHYFLGGCDWWVLETAKDSGLAFGFTVLNGDVHNAEFGYVDLTELESVVTKRGFVVERDLHWEPVPFGKVDPRKREG